MGLDDRLNRKLAAIRNDVDSGLRLVTSRERAVRFDQAKVRVDLAAIAGEGDDRGVRCLR